MAKLQITYSKSTIGFSKDQKTTVRSLGLRKLNSVVLKADTPSIRGMIFKVQHLVSVEEVADDAVLTQHADKPKTTFVRTSEDALPMKARPARPAPMPAAAAPVSEAAPSAPRRASKPRAAAPVEVEAAEPAVVETVAPAAVETVEAAEPAVVETVAPAAMETIEADSVAPAVVETVETEAEPTAQMNVAEVIAPVDTAAPEQSSGDDLTLVEGIGPKVASMLQDAGITTFAQLADAEVEQLRAMLDDADLSMVVPTTWPEQARLAADGRMDELDQFKSELQAGRSQ